jgi:hypothetical protein
MDNVQKHNTCTASFSNADSVFTVRQEIHFYILFRLGFSKF